MAKKKVRCFVAMAFGRQDCDRIYEKYISPTIRRMDIEPIRVDKRQHKDDLNNYIIRMLKDVDIALADLTYARPSVYYEAGFAERRIPIVYTVRKDHLNRSQSDDRLRVHFDLEMKKIIAWSGPNDRTFAKRLRQRLKYLLRPILREREDKVALEVDRRKFQSLSVFDRCNYIRRIFSSRLSSKRFWVKPLEEFHLHATQELSPGVGLVAVKNIDNTCYMCFVLASQTITKKQMQEALYRVTGTELIDTGGKTMKLQDHYFFCALKGLPESRLTSAFSKAEAIPEKGRFRLKRSKRVLTPQSLAFINILPSIDSRARAKQYVQKVIDPFSDRKTNRYTRAVSKVYDPWPKIILRRKK